MTCIAAAYLTLNLMITGWAPSPDREDVWIRYVAAQPWEMPHEDVRVLLVERAGCARLVRLLPRAVPT